MTCIVGWIEGDKVYMGGDSAGVAGNDVRIRADEKVFKNGPMIFGYTTSFRMGQILRYSFDVPDHKDKKDIYEYMCTDFIDSVRKAFRNKGYSTVSNNEESGGTFLVGYQGCLFKICGDFQVGMAVDKFSSVGCGFNYAL